MHNIPTFDLPQAQALKAFLDAPERAPGSMGYFEAAGFLFMLACAPEMVLPAQWMPAVIDPDNAAETDLETKQAVMGGLLSLYNEINRQVREADPRLPSGCRFQDDPMASLVPGASIGQWASGFKAGYLLTEEMWAGYTPPEGKEEFGYHLTVLCFFANRRIATDLHDGLDKAGGITLESMAENMQRIFPDAMHGIAILGATIQEVIASRAAATGKKIGRNDPCSCGSGKKYKKCCG